MVAIEAGRITMDLEMSSTLLVDVHVLRSWYSVHTIILVWYITLHTLLFSGINLFDLLCIFFSPN